MDILIVLEINHGMINRLSLEAISAARNFAKENACTTALLVLGGDEDTPIDEVSALDIGEILLVSHELLKDYSNEGYAQALSQVIAQEQPRYVFAAHSYRSRDFLPKVSARLGIPFISDTIAFRSEAGVIVFTKQVFNNRFAAEISHASNVPCLVSFQAAAFSGGELGVGTPAKRKITVDIDATKLKTQAEQAFRESADGVDLESAKAIVGIGRGMAKAQHIPLARNLADVMGADLGCSRPVVDLGLLPPSRQIGSSGQTVSPDLYLALGISGSVQHVVGMKGSKTIIAVNKDPEAPIFDVADYGVVGDVLELVPPLIEALKT